MHTHTADNLIVLCPTCHTRFDNGEIDRLAIRMYKERLRRIWANVSDEITATSLDTNEVAEASRNPWLIDRLSESVTGDADYEVILEFPQLVSEVAGDGEFNVAQRALAISALQEFRGNVHYFVDEGTERAPGLTSSLVGTFRFQTYSSSLLSVRYDYSWYVAPTPHPNVTTKVQNFRRQPMAPLALHDFLQLGADCLAEISRQSIEQITSTWGLSEPPPTLVAGASPRYESFQKFNITAEGLLLTFDPYDIGSHATGRQRVIIGSGVLRRFLKPNSPVESVWFS